MSSSTPDTITLSPSQDRRADPRGRCLLQGRVLYSSNLCTRDVTIRNLSSNGALIVGERLSELPAEFSLDFTARGAVRKARLVWANNAKAGLELETA